MTNTQKAAEILGIAEGEGRLSGAELDAVNVLLSAIEDLTAVGADCIHCLHDDHRRDKSAKMRALDGTPLCRMHFDVGCRDCDREGAMT